MRLFLEEKYKRIVLHNKILPESKTQDITSREDLDLQSPTSSKAADDIQNDSKLITLDSKLSKLMDKPNFREMIMHWSSLNPAFKIDNIDYAKCDLQFVEKFIQFKRRMADDCSVSSFYINSSEHDKISLIIHMFSVLSISKVTQYETPQLREEAKKMVDMFFADAKDELKMVFRSNNKEQSAQTESNWADRLDAHSPKKLRRYGP